MRDTSEIIPAVHPISGAPLGEPLTTWRVGRAHDAPQAITHVAVMREHIVDGHRSWVLCYNRPAERNEYDIRRS